MTTEEKEALRKWSSFYDNLMAEVPMEHKNRGELEKHKAYLEAHPMEWIRYFFEDYATAEFAPFHEKAIRRCIRRDEWFEVLSWARSLAKSVTVMFIVSFLILTGRKRYVIMVSATQEAARRLLKPYREELEKNPRIRAYYGEQMGNKWTEDEFVTTGDVAFRAIGYGNAPRGTRHKANRPDIILVDDFDTDDACRNPDRVNDMWNFWQKAVYGTRDPAIPLLVIFCGNIIAKDCCVVRAGAIADNWDIVNIRDKNGVSVWPQKNSEAAIDIMLGKVTPSAQQTEYFNNPVQEGEVFKELTWGKVPPLSKFKFLVAYGDPSPSENRAKKNSTKALWLVGELDGTYYVIKGFLDRGLNADFINWYFLLGDYVGGKTTVYNYIENNSLQDPFFRQVFIPLLNDRKQETGQNLSILPDEEKKTDKATRIEANLEPVNRAGRLVLNIAEKDTPHMQRLADQFTLFTLSLKFPADGPDCIEGAKRIIDNKLRRMAPPVVIPARAFRLKNKYRL